MSTTTANFGLIKPELTDVADITAMNENWDKIDEKLGSGNALVVTATIMPSSVTLDKTFDEIYTAWSNGTKVYMSVSDGRYILTPTSVSSTSINFTTVYSYNGKLTLWVVGVFSNNTADQITYVFPTTDEMEAAINTISDNQNWKSYNSLDQISEELTIDNTPAEVATAMPDYSVLTLATGNAYGEYTGGLVPSVENGFLIIRRATIARCTFEFVGENNGMYYAWMRSNIGTWSGWKQVYTEKSPPYTYGTEDLTAGTSELATGKLYLVYE